jgi:hypothetical protein
MKHKLKKMMEWVSIKIAWRLPKNIVKWCFYRVFANATQGRYGNEFPGDVSAFEAIERWQ